MVLQLAAMALLVLILNVFNMTNILMTCVFAMLAQWHLIHPETQLQQVMSLGTIPAAFARRDSLDLVSGVDHWLQQQKLHCTSAIALDTIGH